MIKVFGFVLAFAVGVVVATENVTLTGEHVCHRQENYTETVNLSKDEEVQVRKNFWCLEKIRCSELQPEKKEVVHAENVTKTRTIAFCCPDYEEAELDGKKFCRPVCNPKCVHGSCSNAGNCECELGFKGDTCSEKCPSRWFGKMCGQHCKCDGHDCHPQTGECLKSSTKIELSTTTIQPHEQTTESKIDPMSDNAITTPTFQLSSPTTEHNPYEHYKGEYGKQFNHYVKMGINESDVQGSIDKIVEIETREGMKNPQVVEVDDGVIIFDISENELEQLRQSELAIDHHHHGISSTEEHIAMVTVGCLVLAMLVFLLAMVYIRRVTRAVPTNYDPEADLQKPVQMMTPFKFEPSKIVHEPLPIPPLRPSLRKTKSVTFDESIDEVDEFNRSRTRSLTDAYDIPRKQSSMLELGAKSVTITPGDIAQFYIAEDAAFNTYPRKSPSRKQSIEHVYAEITIPSAKRVKSEKTEDLTATDAVYENQDSAEKTKM